MTLHDQNLAAHSGSTASGEVPFDPADLFYSRTDERGIIIEGNVIFRRISGYSCNLYGVVPLQYTSHTRAIGSMIGSTAPGWSASAAFRAIVSSRRFFRSSTLARIFAFRRDQ